MQTTTDTEIALIATFDKWAGIPSPYNADCLRRSFEDWREHRAFTLGICLSSDLRNVVAAVAERSGVSPTAIMGHSRHRRLSWPRHVCWLIISTKYGLSSAQIGRFFGRNHSSVLNGINTAPGRIERHMWLRMIYEGALDDLRKKKAPRADA